MRRFFLLLVLALTNGLVLSVELDLSKCGQDMGCWELRNSVRVGWRQAAKEGRTELSVEGKIPRGSYLALAFSDDQIMSDDLVVWCNAEAANVGLGYNPPGGADTKTFANPSKALLLREHSWEDEKLLCTFTIPTNITSQYKEVAALGSLDAPLFLLVSSGTNDKGGDVPFANIGYHNRGNAFTPSKVVLSKTQLVKSPPLAQPFLTHSNKDILVKCHGALVSGAWLVGASISILLPRFFREHFVGEVGGKAVWFRLHQGINLFVVVMTVIGALLALWSRGGAWVGPPREIPFSQASSGQKHAVFGVVVLAFAVLQPLIALLRPPSKSRWRWLFSWSHGILGWATWIIALTTLFYATEMGPLRSDENGTLARKILILFCIVYAILLIILCLRHFRSRQGHADDNFQPIIVGERSEKRYGSVVSNVAEREFIIPARNGLSTRGVLLALFLAIACLTWIAFLCFLIP